MTFLAAADEGIPLPLETLAPVETVDPPAEQIAIDQSIVVEPLPVDPVDVPVVESPPVEPQPVDSMPVEPVPVVVLPTEQPIVEQPPGNQPSGLEPAPVDPADAPVVELPSVEPQSVVEQPIVQATVESVIVPEPPQAAVDVPAVSTAPTGVSGQILLPLRSDSSGIVVILTSPNGSRFQAVTNSIGMFAFAGLQPGNYRLDAGAVGFLSVQIALSLTGGQVVNLAPVTLTGGDTNLDNVIDLSDAALIAANFNVPAPVAEADVNRDGLVDIRDLTAIGADFGRSGPLSWQ
jgi:hypothetical protein